MTELSIKDKLLFEDKDMAEICRSANLRDILPVWATVTIVCQCQNCALFVILTAELQLCCCS
jgi:hypothetical protein